MAVSGLGAALPVCAVLYFLTMRSLARASALVAILSFIPVLAVAETPAPIAAAGSGAAPAADADAPSAASSAPAKAVVPATGYSYGAAATQRVDHAHVRAGHGSPVGTDARMAGFETLADGSTRLFVELSRPVAYDTKAGRSTLTYVLKGAHADRRNNQNPLVTVHFNTPVTSARLTPHGPDLWLVVDLRANVQPTATMDATKDGTGRLRIEFPKGEYLPAEGDPTAPPSPVPSAAADPPASPAPPAP